MNWNTPWIQGMAYRETGNVGRRPAVFTTKERHTTSQQQPRHANHTQSTSHDRQPMRLETPIHIDPVVTRTNINRLAIVRDIDLRETVRRQQHPGGIDIGRVASGHMAASTESKRRRHIAQDLDASGHLFAGGGFEDAFGVLDRADRVEVFTISYLERIGSSIGA